jgi:hypothetical protein
MPTHMIYDVDLAATRKRALGVYPQNNTRFRRATMWGKTPHTSLKTRNFRHLSNNLQKLKTNWHNHMILS